jgi:hypothetical protein
MQKLGSVLLVMALGAMPLVNAAQQPTTESQVVDRIVNREWEEMQLIRQFSPVIETYVQNFREDKHLEAVPDGDKYLLGVHSLIATSRRSP